MDKDMTIISIMAGIGTRTRHICKSSSPYPIKKVRYSACSFPFPYPYSINAGIPRQNMDGFGNTHEAGLFVILNLYLGRLAQP